MPVLEHEVHERVRQSADFRYGCHNRPLKFKKAYWAVGRRLFPDCSFEFIAVRVPHAMSHECRYDLSLKDRNCEGCCHRGIGDSYAAGVRASGK